MAPCRSYWIATDATVFGLVADHNVTADGPGAEAEASVQLVTVPSVVKARRAGTGRSVVLLD